MRLWDALSNAMRTSRNRRIGSWEAEQLLTADPSRSAHLELGRLLAAAAAPPFPDELTGLRTAVAAFEAARQDDGSSTVAPRRRRVFAGPVFVKAVAGAALVLSGGAALAAETGSLPSGVQQHAHDVFSVLGVPPPTATPSPASSAARHVTPTGPPSTGSQTQASRPTTAAAFGLCRSWQARQKNPKNKPMKAEALRALAAAAGGAEHIAAFCLPLLAGDQGSAAPSDPASVAATPSHPGTGKGHVRTTPTPNPHRNG